MRKLKYVKLFENFQINEGIMDVFKSKETKEKEANLAETKKKLDEFEKLLDSVRKYFPKSLESLKHNRDLSNYYREVVYNTNITNKTRDSIYALLHGGNSSTDRGKGIGSAWKVGISILNQLEKSNGDYTYNIGLQNAILNYDKSKQKGEEKTFVNTIKNAGTFVSGIRYFLEITKSLEEKYPVGQDKDCLKDLKTELSERVEKIFRETKSIMDEHLGNKEESLWIWNWIKTGKEPSPISEVLKK